MLCEEETGLGEVHIDLTSGEMVFECMAAEFIASPLYDYGYHSSDSETVVSEN